MDESLFDVLVQTCCVIIRGRPGAASNIHKDLRQSIAALEDACELSEHEVEVIKQDLKNDWPPSSVSFNWDLDARSQQEVCTILLNSSYKFYESIVTYPRCWSTDGDYRCWDCNEPPGQDEPLGKAAQAVTSLQARTLIYIKGRQGAKPRSLRLEMAECLIMLEQFLKKGSALDHSQIQRPLRQVIFTKWRLPNKEKKIRPHGKISLAGGQGGPIHLTWLTLTGLIDCLQCGGCYYFKS